MAGNEIMLDFETTDTIKILRGRVFEKIQTFCEIIDVDQIVLLRGTTTQLDDALIGDPETAENIGYQLVVLVCHPWPMEKHMNCCFLRMSKKQS